MESRDYIFNREKLEERLKLIRNVFYGYNTPMAEYVCGRKGVLSDEKIETFADELIGLMHRYNMRYKYYGMDGAARRFLKLYIYLLVRAYRKDTGTFGDIPCTLRDMMQRYGSLDELILRETGWRPQPEEDEWDEDDGDCGAYVRYPMAVEGFFAELNESYRMLAGHSIGDEPDDEELRQIWERNEARSQQQEAAWTARESVEKEYEDQALEPIFPGDPDYNFDLEASYGLEPPEYENSQWESGLSQEEDQEQGEEVLDDFRSRYQLLEEEQKAAELERKNHRERWKASFSDPEKFLKAYKEFRELFFRVDINYIADALEEAVICFLCQEHKSGLEDNEKFLRLYVQLDKVYRLIGRL